MKTFNIFYYLCNKQFKNMFGYDKSHDRNSEMVAFYYAIFGNRIRKGLSQADARKEACDAVTLRYGIGRGRMLNIISEKEYSLSVNDSELKKKAMAIIEELKAANEWLAPMVEKNERLISLMEECLNND